MEDTIKNIVMVMVPMILSLTIHEFSHALSAKLFGDDTAEKMGRLNLNPVSHIDPIGTLFLPIILIASGVNIFFGWAKPVPVSPNRFRASVSPRVAMMLTALAGPLSNFFIALLSMSIISAGVVYYFFTIPEVFMVFLVRLVYINVALCVFNMIPIGPLDGQKVLSGILPLNTAIAYERFNQQYGSFLLIGIFIFGSQLIHVPFQTLIQQLNELFSLSL